ncbi:helix-turn-helix domain-containing protein [Pseudovibrio sp. Tun.PSC04-5.I4]|uniref:helix-turn-helix domain-containing protein n=1 Tax=Pseudovibrio sp. Tun.PSC04-5.I4 TaxID=1798213 RepID=UPI00087EBA7F|nr:helix-turn-helix domain-containing protein [Pseudovibrio sp. Tun.PSC04-5.I4]SDQ99399.1 Helix-turn-helix domain-containing protein [Pseudovibrio sp. Tun.PSC04-5.I4]
MTAKKKRKWSYMPIGIFADPDLSPRDLQVMGVLCSSTNEYSICYRSQVKIAKLLRIGRTTVHRAIQKLIKAGWLEREGGKRKDGGSCSFIYRVINKDLLTADQADLFEPDLEEEAQRREEKRCENGRGLSTQADTYNNETIITIKDDDKAAASGANMRNARFPSHAKRQEDTPLKRYTNAVVSAIAELKPELDVARMSGGTNPIMGWFTVGCDLERDVKPAIAMVLERAPVLPRSLNYFTQAIISARKSRTEIAEINPRFVKDGGQAKVKRARELEASRRSCSNAIDELSAEFAAGGV